MGTTCCRSENVPTKNQHMDACAEERFPVDNSECQLQLGHEEAHDQAAQEATQQADHGEDGKVTPAAPSEDVLIAQAKNDQIAEPAAAGEGVLTAQPENEKSAENAEVALVYQADEKIAVETESKAVVQTDAVQVNTENAELTVGQENKESSNEKHTADTKKASVKAAAAKKKKDADEAKKKAAAQQKKAEEDAKRQAAEAAQRAIEDEESRKREGQQKARARKKIWKSIDPTKQKDMIAKLCEAAAKGDVSILLQLLDEHVDVDVFGPKGEYMTPLHLACEAGHAEFAKALVITAGADPCGTIKASANTPLHLAVLNNHADCCAIVGAPRALTMKNGQGKTPKELAEAAGSKAALKALKHLSKKH